MDSEDPFIRRQNIEHYQRLLETVSDPAERQLILRLLAEEHQKQLVAAGRAGPT